MKPGIALYMEGIIKFTKLRLGDMKKGEKSLPTYLPLAVKKKIFSVFSQTSGGNNRVVTPELKVAHKFIQYQVAHPELRSYTRSWGVVHHKSSYIIIIPLNNGRAPISTKIHTTA